MTIIADDTESCVHEHCGDILGSLLGGVVTEGLSSLLQSTISPVDVVLLDTCRNLEPRELIDKAFKKLNWSR